MFNFLFKKSSVEINKTEIINEGWVSKESKYRKIWREYFFKINSNRRWCVLTSNYLSTYEKENDFSSPTEVIEIRKVKTVKSDEQDKTIFRVETFEGVYQFKVKTFQEKENWIGSIGKAMVKQSGPTVFIKEENN